MTRKGFEEHKILYKRINQIKPNNLLEIGVYNGENAKNMIKKGSKHVKEVNYFGFDKFNKYSKEKIKNKLKDFSANINLIKGDTKQTLSSNLDKLPIMDLVFIDGGHEYETVRSDWQNTKKIIDEDTFIYFHNFDFSGVNKTVKKINQNEFETKILDPQDDCKTALVRKK